jgi:6,7-dimethyl-8-ribityllumazine synthase
MVQFLRIGIVQARFNEDITDALPRLALPSSGAWCDPNIDHVMVPGALEVPVALQALAERASTTR